MECAADLPALRYREAQEATDRRVIGRVIRSILKRRHYVQWRLSVEQILCRDFERHIGEDAVPRTGVVAQRGVKGGKRSTLPAVGDVGHATLVVSEDRQSTRLNSSH